MADHFSIECRIPLTWRSFVGPAAIVIVFGAACCMTWMQQTVWFAFLALIGSGALGVSIAMQSTRCTTLRLGYYHVMVWILMGLAAAAMAIQICLSYNEIAGTDKTPMHIAQIAASVFSGPMVGPIANSGAGSNFRDGAARLTALLLFFVVVGTSPFMLVRRPVSKPIALLAWIGFLVPSFLWFMGSLVSLGVFLS